MTDPLDQLYEAAHKLLQDYLPGPPMKVDDDGFIESAEPAPQIVERAGIALQIIDRWLRRREADRQHELRRYESGIDYVPDENDSPGPVKPEPGSLQHVPAQDSP